MSVNPILLGLAPVKLASTVFPAADVELSPNVSMDPWRSSGDLFASQAVVLGAAPAFRFRTPDIVNALAICGMKHSAQLSVAEFYLAPFTVASADRQTTCQRWKLNTGAFAFAVLTGFRVAQDSLLMAEVTVFTASSDGLVATLTNDTAAIPALVAPALYTMGPVTANGTTLWGAAGWSCDLGHGMLPQRSDGAVFPTAFTYRNGDPTITLDHQDPATLWAQLGALGLDAASGGFAVWATGVDNTSAAAPLLTTGLSVTAAAGRATLESAGAANNDVATAAVRILCLSAIGSATHPLAYATAATVPTT